MNISLLSGAATKLLPTFSKVVVPKLLPLLFISGPFAALLVSGIALGFLVLLVVLVRAREDKEEKEKQDKLAQSFGLSTGDTNLTRKLN